jgi:hypothetical protein
VSVHDVRKAIERLQRRARLPDLQLSDAGHGRPAAQGDRLLPRLHRRAGHERPRARRPGEADPRDGQAPRLADHADRPRRRPQRRHPRAPGLYRALGQLAAGRADGLVVAKLDRLTRSTVDFGLLLEWFKDASKTLVLLDLGVDTSTAGGELVANVIASVAQWERGVISERTRAALAQLRLQGRPTGRPAVVDDQALRERITRMKVDEELTLRQICDRLNAEGVPTMRGAARWQPSAIQSALGYKRPRKPRRIAELPSVR